MFGNLAKTVSGIIGKMSLSGGIMATISGALGGGIDQRQAFVSVLLATAAHANQKKNFNLELEINDLWIHLSALRDQAPSSPAGSLQDMSGLMQQLGQFENGIQKSLEAILKNMK